MKILFRPRKKRRFPGKSFLDVVKMDSIDDLDENTPSIAESDFNDTLLPILGPISCLCVEHKGKTLVDVDLPLTVEQTFQLLFAENDWLAKFEKSCKRSEKKSTQWSEEAPGKRERVCKYTFELDKTFGPKASFVTEIQTLTLIGSFHEGYTVLKEATNEGVPYADSFVVECSYCVTRLSNNSCKLRVHGGITFKKYLFGLIKTVIERSTFTGLTNYYNALVENLKADGTSLASKIPNIQSLDDDAAQISVSDSVGDASVGEPAVILETSTRNVIFEERRGIVRQRSVASPSSHPENLDSIVFLLKIILFVLILSVFVQLWLGFTEKRENSCLNHSEFQDLKRLVGDLASRLDSLQKHVYGDAKKQEL